MNRFSSLAAELRGIPRLTAESARRSRVRSLTGTSMLMALSVLLNQFTIFISALIRVSFTFPAIAAAGMLFGPVLTGWRARPSTSSSTSPATTEAPSSRVHDQ
ncbi:MAG: hypothetical protein ACLVL7_08115 [Anaerotruncus massiliensis (ex Togo et al. 2019)]